MEEGRQGCCGNQRDTRRGVAHGDCGSGDDGRRKGVSLRTRIRHMGGSGTEADGIGRQGELARDQQEGQTPICPQPPGIAANLGQKAVRRRGRDIRFARRVAVLHGIQQRGAVPHAAADAQLDAEPGERLVQRLPVRTAPARRLEKTAHPTSASLFAPSTDAPASHVAPCNTPSTTD